MSIADPSLVLLVGPSGGGKSTFARRSFPAGTVLSSDELRGILSGDPNDQGASAEAFQVLAMLINGRLRRGLLTVVDATNLRPESRRRWRSMARRYGLPAVAICFDLSLEDYVAFNRARPERQVEEEVVMAQAERMRRAMADTADEGFDGLWVLRSPAEVAAAEVELERY
ncbi:MAG TPA: AAA family ATPase [Candidatus Limnocylindrales bacterium]|nr:AAA family ATPase [Candidatus Limnocylindrales bacterium]